MVSDNRPALKNLAHRIRQSIASVRAFNAANTALDRQPRDKYFASFPLDLAEEAADALESGVDPQSTPKSSKERNARALLDTLHSIACAYDEERFGLPLHSKSFGPQLLKAVEDWATPVETSDAHIANEWADMATNGVQWLRNVRDGISSAAEGLAEMEQNLLRIRALQSSEKSAAPETGCKPESCERLRDCEISLGTYDPGADSEYWLKYGSTTVKSNGDQA